jgi:hypothetical protein
MKEKFYQKKGFYQSLFTSVLIIAIAVITDRFKTLFVPETGNLKLFGGIGIILALGLLLKWKYVRQILAVLVLIALFAMIFILINTSSEFILNQSILLIALAVASYFLILSSSVRNYVKSQ